MRDTWTRRLVILAAGAALAGCTSQATASHLVPRPPASSAPVVPYLVFRAWGTGDPPVIDYGDDASPAIQAAGTAGPVGDGTPLPWSADLALPASWQAGTYRIYAWSEGPGYSTNGVSVSITLVTASGHTVVATGHWPGGGNPVYATYQPGMPPGMQGLGS
jgi:hypothetical protein